MEGQREGKQKSYITLLKQRNFSQEFLLVTVMNVPIVLAQDSGFCERGLSSMCNQYKPINQSPPLQPEALAFVFQWHKSYFN